MLDAPIHPVATFWLGVVDEIIKLAAVLIGGLWALWNFRKSRVYEQKLELEIVGTVFIKTDLYGDVKVSAKNIGGTRHVVQKAGSFCEISVILDDLSEHIVELFRVFTDDDSMEPGVSIADTKYWCIEPPIENIVWVKLSLRVVSNGVDWRWSSLVRVVQQLDNALDAGASDDTFEEEI
jgi:hypothetical protein